jgi:formylglycine-generating enzyme required for sulfatase activity
MGRSEVNGVSDYYPDASVILPEETPEHNATVSDFALDKYEVTVGRFRAFVAAYNPWHAAGNPKSNAGAHPIAPYTGWGRSWMSSATDLPADAAALTAMVKCSTYNQTWKDTADTNEAYPINCVNWFVAFAFCIWDGGRLPTEAEWEYAAAAGAANRLFPWGSAAPDATRANYMGSDWSPLVPVGSKVNLGGAGAFGHADLAGSVAEWVFDWFSSSYYGTSGAAVSCSNCANATQSTDRGLRGGCFWSEAMNLRGANRSHSTPDANPYYTNGIRCARAPQ